MPPSQLPEQGGLQVQKAYAGELTVALQPSPIGSLEPLPVTNTDGISSKVHWNLDPLLMEADALLPLHIACLFRASPEVISSLLEAHPKAAKASALGMLPIHMVCVSFDLPAPVLAPPPGPVPFPHDDEFDMAESIRRLEAAFPEGLDYPSESNGMTPRKYIDETLDDGLYKDSCLEALGVVPDNEEETVAEARVSHHDDSTLTTRDPDLVHCDDDSSTLPSSHASSRYPGQDLPQIIGFCGSRLYSQMVKKDWEKAVETIEKHPKEGRRWQYGIELDRVESSDSPVMWKRLPIHSACVLHSPIELVEALLWAYPKGIRVKDPITGSLPLHSACHHSAPPELVKALVMAYPTGCRIADVVGRLPLHMACLSGASRLTFLYLLKAYPPAVLVKHDRRMTPLQYAKENPTLTTETIELLELVLPLVEKQPAVEDDYTFEGFSTPQSVGHGCDDGSTVSSFYEGGFSIGSPYSPSTVEHHSHGSQPSHKEVNEDRLAEEFSQILQEDKKDDGPSMGLAPSDVSAGRSSLTIPHSTVISNEGMTCNRSGAEHEVAAVEQAGTLHKDTNPYEHLVDETDALETPATLAACDHPAVSQKECITPTDGEGPTSTDVHKGRGKVNHQRRHSKHHHHDHVTCRKHKHKTRKS